MLALGGLKASDFDQKVWDALQVDGKRYAIPIDTHPFVLYYNADVCEKAGLLDADGNLKEIRGTDAWESALQAAKKVTGAWGASVATVGDNADELAVVPGALLAAGGGDALARRPRPAAVVQRGPHDHDAGATSSR